MKSQLKTIVLVGTVITVISGCSSKGGFTSGLRMLNPFESKVAFIEPPSNPVMHPYLNIYIRSDDPNNPLMQNIKDAFANASDGEAPYFKRVSTEVTPDGDNIEVKAAEVRISIVSSSVNDKRYTEDHFTCPGKKLVKTCSAKEAIHYTATCITRTANITASLNITDLSSNDILLERNSTQSSTSKICNDESGATLDTEKSLLTSAAINTQAALIDDLLPKFIKRPSDLIDNIEGFPGEDIAQLEEASKAASENDVRKARDIYLNLAKIYPTNGVILFNAGLTEQALGNFGKAKDYYAISMQDASTPNEDIARYQDEVNNWISKGYETLKK